MSVEYDTPEERLYLAEYGKKKRAIMRRTDGALLATGSPEAIARTAEALGLDYERAEGGPEAGAGKCAKCSTTRLKYAWLRAEVCLKTHLKEKLPPVTNPATLADIVHEVYDFKNAPGEVICVLAVDTKNVPLGLQVVAQGGIKEVATAASDILRPVMLLQAPSFFLIHNHPSGSLDPSTSDEELTEKVSHLAKEMGLKCLDHIIVTPTRGDYYSFVARETHHAR